MLKQRAVPSTAGAPAGGGAAAQLAATLAGLAEEPAAEGEPLPAKRGRGRPRREEKAEGKGGDENAAETADA